tara:strand:+ start:2001 stop:2507 length:507 start_codon:yes stop_codon:yes gene_type:complete
MPSPMDTPIPSDPPTAGAIADQVWDEAISGHTTINTTCEILEDLLAAEMINDADSYKNCAPASSGSSDTFGSYAEYDDSTGAERKLTGGVILLPGANALQHALVEIAVGNASSEVTIARFMCGNPAASGAITEFKCPNIVIASGARISIRVKDAEASARAYQVMLNLV